MTPRLVGALLRLAADLEALRLSWALVGGLAVSARAEPRTTRDVDVVVAVADDPEAERVVKLLQNRSYRLMQPLEHSDRDRLAAVRLLAPGDWKAEEGAVLADLLFASSGIEEVISTQADLLEVLPGAYLPVAKTGHLMAMKVLALRPNRPQDRPQDLTDLRELLHVAADEEIWRCRDALDLISRRGYERGKDLMADFEEQLQQFRRAQRDGGS